MHTHTYAQTRTYTHAYGRRTHTQTYAHIEAYIHARTHMHRDAQVRTDGNRLLGADEGDGWSGEGV